MFVLKVLILDYQSSTSSNYQIIMGLFLIFISAILLLFKEKLLNWREKSGDGLFTKDLRKTHEFRFWLGIVVFLILGLWLLIKYFNITI